MIICHQYKFIFIKCRKTAGTSLEIALSKFCSENDIITPISKVDEEERGKLGYPGPQNYHVPYPLYKPYDWARLLVKQRRKAFYNHMPAKELRTYLPQKVWDSYFKFCFERNPFDKIISHYYWAGGEKKFGNLTQYWEDKGYKELQGFDMYSERGKILVDQIYKYEELPGALEVLSQHLKLPQPISLPIFKAKSGYRKDKRPYFEILSPSERQKIETHYSRELSLLKYSF